MKRQLRIALFWLVLFLIPITCTSTPAPSSSIGDLLRMTATVEAGPTAAMVAVDGSAALNSGDSIRVSGGRGRARLSLLNGSVTLELYDGTDGSVRTSGSQEAIAYLSQGGLDVNVSPGSTCTVQVPNGTFNILGTDAFVIYDPKSATATAGNFHGTVTWSAAGQVDQVLAPGTLIDIGPGGTPSAPYKFPFDADEFRSTIDANGSPITSLRVLREQYDIPPAGQAAGTLKLVSSLPKTDFSSAMINAMQLRLTQADFRACGGKYALEYESWDEVNEKDSAYRASADKSIVAYIGPRTSEGAKLSIPILNQAGPLVMISPFANYPGLTKPGTGQPGEPEKYYPTGVRNFARIAHSYDVQGAVAARFIRDTLDAATVFIIDDGDIWTRSVADAFQATAKEIGLTVVDRRTIDPAAGSYDLMISIAHSNDGEPPDAIYVSALDKDYAYQLLQAKVEIMGNNFEVKFVGSDGIRTQSFIDGAGANRAEGVYASDLRVPFQMLPETGQAFYRQYAEKFGPTTELDAAYAYEAMSAALQAIEDVCASGGDPSDREAVRAAVFAIENFDGLLGTWSFDANGDISLTDTPFYQVGAGEYHLIGIYK